MGYNPNDTYTGKGTTTGTSVPGSSKNKKQPRVASSKEKGKGEVLTQHSTIYSRGEDPKAHEAKYSSIDALLKEGYKKPKDWVSARQQELIDAGILDPDDITRGLYDEKTLAAYQTLLLRASFSGRTPEEEAKYAKSLGASGKAGAAGPKRDPFSFQPKDPAAVRDALNEVMPTLIGRALSPAETEAVVQAYQAKTVAAARSAYDHNISGGVAAPDVDFSAFAKAEAERRAPDEFKARQMADLSAAFLKSIQGNLQADRVF